MVYYTGKPIEKGIRTTRHKQKPAIDLQTMILERLKKEQVTYPALLNIKSVGFHILLLP